MQINKSPIVIRAICLICSSGLAIVGTEGLIGIFSARTGDQLLIHAFNVAIGAAMFPASILNLRRAVRGYW